MADRLLEELSELEHEQWLAWVGSVIKEFWAISSGHDANCECISCKRIRRWQPNMIPYSQLDEATKEFDREWARKVIAKLDAECRRIVEEMIEEIQAWIMNRSGPKYLMDGLLDKIEALKART